MNFMFGGRSNVKRSNRRSNVKRSNRRNNVKRSNKRSNRRTNNVNGTTFAARLGSFILDTLTDNTVISSDSDGFDNRQTQVSGVLPYLHLNITEQQFRNHLNSSKQLTNLCNSKRLTQRLRPIVGFKCELQSRNGVNSMTNSIIDSINNDFGKRTRGLKHLRAVLKRQRWQASNLPGFPQTSIAWGKNL
jgi:hypothetical protein